MEPRIIETPDELFSLNDMTVLLGSDNWVYQVTYPTIASTSPDDPQWDYEDVVEAGTFLPCVVVIDGEELFGKFGKLLDDA